MYTALFLGNCFICSQCGGTHLNVIYTNYRKKETFRSLRKHLPGFIASERRIEQLKCKWHKEFEVVLQPSRTKTGWCIDPERLRECILFAYPWLRKVDTEWWRLYDDASSFGGQKSVLFSLSIINNEAMFHDCSFQSPEENCWPIHIFLWPRFKTES